MKPTRYLFLFGCFLCVINQAEADLIPRTPYLRAISDLSPSLSWPWPTLTAEKQMTLSFFPHYPDLEAVESPSKSLVVVIGQIPGAYFDVPRCFDQEDRVKGAKCARWSPFSDVESPPHTEKSRNLQTRRNIIRKMINAVMHEQVARFPEEVAFVDPYQSL